MTRYCPIFWQQNQPIRLCLSNTVRHGRKIYVSFLNDISLAPKVQICIIAVLVKASWMQCRLHNEKVNQPSFHGASCQLAPFNSQTIWTHEYSTNQQQCTGSKCSLWGMKMTIIPKLVGFRLYTLYVVIVVVGCMQSSWSQVSTFRCYSHCIPQFSITCAVIQISMFCKTVSPAPVFVRIPGSHYPGTRIRLVPRFRDPGSVPKLGQVTPYGNPYLICIAAVLAPANINHCGWYLKKKKKTIAANLSYMRSSHDYDVVSGESFY